MCRKTSGISIGRLCDKCDGKCPVCDSYVRPTTLVRICDECSFGNYQNKCVVCGGEGISDAFYCFECTRLEKDRDGCPKMINLGSSGRICSTRKRISGINERTGRACGYDRKKDSWEAQTAVSDAERSGWKDG
jgi:PHD finger-like domain-containing protein 5A